MGCLDNYISLNGYCGDEQTTPLSGYDLFDAPEISKTNLANIANEDYISGKALAQAKITQAIRGVKNDLMKLMAANDIIPYITDQRLTTGRFQTGTTIEAAAYERGQTLFRNPKIKGKLRKLTIHTVKIYPLVDADSATLKIYDCYLNSTDGAIENTYNIALVANQTNEFNVAYTVQNDYARVVLNGEDISLASSFLTMCAGCHGGMPNDCGYTKSSYNGTDSNGKEGYGILLDFSCVCDYDELMCALSRTFMGELVYLKARILLLEERLRSNRLDNWIIYSREETQGFIAEIKNEYAQSWNLFVDSAPNLLKTFQDDCLTCMKTRWVDNV